MILGYVRVSTADQQNGTSPEEQERVIRGVAMTKGADSFGIEVFFDLGVSGATPLAQRPQGKELLATMKQGDTIIACKMDRLFRSASDALATAEQFKKAGVHLILVDMGMEPVTENGTAKMFFGMLALVAEFERDRINERMQDGRKAKRANDGCIGAVPYGYRKVGKGKNSYLEPIPEEQDVILFTKKLVSKNLTPWEIVLEFRKEHILTRKGKPWQMVQVQRLMERVNG